ncbi:uncharacterized protein LOC132925767 [Rhopalosiphum padi]|uniref:uncharacterized protein LOC132925767 n=1 Tax=Rhopalosiphum padi TaxID=40932 RepID=UPI00298EB1BF|nr:uncharacterized protein LOC132925767 [Rhopalosiphum padi]
MFKGIKCEVRYDVFISQYKAPQSDRVSHYRVNRAVSSFLIESVFPDILNYYLDHNWLCNRAILAARNVDVNEINFHIQQILPGDLMSFKSIDTVIDENETVNFPTEFLNSLDLPGMPPHNLQLKIGSPIILLRNLNPPQLCNGTRLVIKK